MGLWSYFLDMMSAASFAEAGERATAVAMADEAGRRFTAEAHPSPWQQQWAAVAFAEAGLPDTAARMVDEADARRRATATLSSWDRHMAAVSFAEAGDQETARTFVAARPATGIEVHDRRLGLWVGDQQRFTAAAALAEGGAFDHARQLLNEQNVRKQILVVGNQEVIPAEAAQYGIVMAERMDFDLVFANVTVATAESTAAGRDRFREGFRQRARNQCDRFLKQADGLGIRCRHMVGFGERQAAIRSLCDELGNVAFVLAEPESAVANGGGAVPIFTIDHVKTTNPQHA